MTSSEKKQFLELIEDFDPESQTMLTYTFYQVLGLALYSVYDDKKYAERDELLKEKYNNDKPKLDVGKKCINVAKAKLNSVGPKRLYDEMLKKKFRTEVKKTATDKANKATHTISQETYEDLSRKWNEYTLEGNINLLLKELGFTVSAPLTRPQPVIPKASPPRPTAPTPVVSKRVPKQPANRYPLDRAKQTTLLFIIISIGWVLIKLRGGNLNANQAIIEPAYFWITAIVLALGIWSYYSDHNGRITFLLFGLIACLLYMGNSPLLGLFLAALPTYWIAQFVFKNTNTSQLFVYILPILSIVIYSFIASYAQQLYARSQHPNYNIELMDKMGYVSFIEGTDIRMGPSTTTQLVTVVPYGSPIKIFGQDKESGWYKVSFINAQNKWYSGFLSGASVGFEPIKVAKNLKVKRIKNRPVETSNSTKPDELAPQETAPTSDEIFSVVEIQPEFPGGQSALSSWLATNLRVPTALRLVHQSGRVFTRFVVNSDGSIQDVEVLKGLGFGADDEAERLIKSMPSWQPGKQAGRPVRVLYSLPINFPETTENQ